MKKTVTTFAKAKQSGEKLTMLTAYDYSTAKLMDVRCRCYFGRRFTG